MKPYRCHTLVTAFRIKEVRQKPGSLSTWNGEWELVPFDDDPVTVDNMWYLAQRPAAGGYYVVDGRGTATYVGQAAFEDAYHEEPSDE